MSRFGGVRGVGTPRTPPNLGASPAIPKEPEKTQIKDGTIVLLMETYNSQTAPAPPGILTTLIAGFDVITNHIALILFPVGLDLLIWLAPHLRLKTLIEAWMAVVFQPISDMPDAAEMMEAAETLWTLMAERFNLLITLRSYPVGIPSLVVSSLPLQIPDGEPVLIDIPSMGIALLLAGLFTFFGLLVGALYFAMVGRAAIHDEVRPLKTIMEWPRSSGQVVLLAFVWFGLLLGISIPLSCGVSLLALVGIPVGPITVLVFGSLLLWIAFPLLFSPHGIFVNQDGAWASIKKSVQITRMTLPTTATFFVAVMLLSQGLDMLWRIPPEDSWLMLIGVVGHAFVSTSLLSASFIYYHQADKWLESFLEKKVSAA
ncbi:MAG: hypothetical protein H8D37_04625 [Chloroflexi bacterium]|nr:hypothetical protein [Chloroflexota bacterium]